MLRFKTWAGAIALSLALSFSLAAVLQQRQSALQQQTAHSTYRLHYLSWAAFQLEKEALRLRYALEQALEHPRQFDAEALSLRWEVFTSRLQVMEEGVDRQRLEAVPEALATLQRLRRLVAEHDAVLAGAAPVQDVAQLRAPTAALQSLTEPLHVMTQRTHTHVSELDERISAQLRDWSRLSLALTLFQCALVLAFGLLVLRKVRQLDERRGLEALAQHLEEARREAEHARGQAEEASRAKSAFLANMSHELRTPIHGMLGMMGLLRGSALNARQADWLHTAQESARHLLSILNDVLDLSRLEAGRLALDPAPVALQPLLDEVEALMRPLAEGKGLALACGRAPAAAAWLRADGTRLKQILFNLLGNAIKFTERGAVRLEVGLDARQQLVLAVHDSGPGIDAPTLARLFRRFEQGDASSTRRSGGTGLGLEISRTLAQLMGGDIRAASTPGAGSTFTVSLPLPACEPPAASASAAPAVAHGALRGLRVLVADDHPVNRKYLAALLESEGIEAVFCDNGRQALQLLQAQPVDVVLMDVHMPEMDGLEATQALRGMGAPLAALPVVALTADAFDTARERALHAGMNDFLGKPVEPQQLLQVLARHAPRKAAPVRSDAAAGAPPDDAQRCWIDAPAVQDAVRRGWLAPHTLRDLASLLPLPRWLALARMVLHDETGTLRALHAARDAGDAAALRRAAHALKGAAAGVALHALAQGAGALQDAADRADLAGCTALLARLDADRAHSLHAVEALAGADSPSPSLCFNDEVPA